MNGRAWISERLLGRCAGCLVLLILGGVLPGSVQAQLTSFEKAGLSGPLDPALYAGECNFSNLPGIVWWGTETRDDHRAPRLAGGAHLLVLSR